VPWVEPPVYRPPAPAKKGSTPAVPPVLVGAIFGLVIVVILILIVAG